MKTLMLMIFLFSQVAMAVPNSSELLNQSCQNSPEVKIKPSEKIKKTALCQCVSEEFSQFVDRLNAAETEIAMMTTAIKYYQGRFEKSDYLQDKHNTTGLLWDLTDKCIYLNKTK